MLESLARSEADEAPPAIREDGAGTEGAWLGGKGRRWISVEEQLPEVHVTVLVYLPDEFDSEVCLQLGSRAPEDSLLPGLRAEPGPQWGWTVRVERDGFEAPAHSRVTHWMPLPEPPA
jgi:hypothetical protein